MSPELTRVLEEVTEQTTINASLRDLLSKLSELIRRNIDDKPALAALAVSLDTENKVMTDAIVAHTPAEDSPNP